MLERLQLDPTFHPSPRLAMQAQFGRIAEQPLARATATKKFALVTETASTERAVP